MVWWDLTKYLTRGWVTFQEIIQACQFILHSCIGACNGKKKVPDRGDQGLNLSN